MFLQDCSIERLLDACTRTGVSRFEVDGEAVRVEFFGGPKRLQEFTGNALGQALEVKAPRPDATVEELEAQAPEHPLDAILNQPVFAVGVPEPEAE